MTQRKRDILDFETQHSMLWGEYLALQGKIDKIGAFKFQIKGWIVTLVVGGAAIGKLAKDKSEVVNQLSVANQFSNSGDIKLWFLLLVFSMVFWRLEHEQSQRGARYGKRCVEIEKIIRDSLPLSKKYTHTPHIAKISVPRHRHPDRRILWWLSPTNALYSFIIVVLSTLFTLAIWPSLICLVDHLIGGEGCL